MHSVRLLTTLCTHSCWLVPSLLRMLLPPCPPTFWRQVLAGWASARQGGVKIDVDAFIGVPAEVPAAV